jgi:hypothetical protein
VSLYMCSINLSARLGLAMLVALCHTMDKEAHLARDEEGQGANGGQAGSCGAERHSETGAT